MNSKLHHFTCNIKPNTLEIFLELMEKFNVSLSYRKNKERWCMLEQKPLKIDIQVIETQDQPVPAEIKTNTHIAFISSTHAKDIAEIKRWAESKNLKFVEGKWYDEALWFDLPDIFINFVIEIMYTSVVE